MNQPSHYDQLKTRLTAEPHTWLVTGVAGFIGSNLLETLLKLNQPVTQLLAKLKQGGVFIDIKSAYQPEVIEAAGFKLWRL